MQKIIAININIYRKLINQMESASYVIQKQFEFSNKQVSCVQSLPEDIQGLQKIKSKLIQEDSVKIQEEQHTDKSIIFLSKLKSSLLKNASQNSLLDEKVFIHSIQKLQNLYFRDQEKYQLVQLMKNYFQVNFEGLTSDVLKSQFYDELLAVRKLGHRIHQIQNRAYFNNRNNYQIIQFITNKNFQQMKINQLAAKVRILFQKNEDSFAILSLYLLNYVQKQLQKKDFNQVQKEFLSLIKNLQQEYPPSNVEGDFQKHTDVIKNFKLEYQIEEIDLSKTSIKKVDIIKEFIIKKVQDAEKDYNIFSNLVYDSCSNKGYGVKTDIKIKKIKGQYDIKSIERTIDKVTEKLRQNRKNLYRKTIKKNMMTQNRARKFSHDILIQQIQAQRQKIGQLTQQILNRQKSIQFKIKDLLRGKCTFQKIQKLVQTAQILLRDSGKFDYKVIQVKNRFLKNKSKIQNKSKTTCDIVLILKLPYSIAELQLVLKLDSYANEFNHKLYELQRSSSYSLITNLYIQNQRWCEKLFVQITSLLQFMSQVKKQPQFEISQKKFADFKQNYNNFVQNVLIPNQVKYKKNSDQDNNQNNRIERQYNKIIERINKNQYKKELKRIKKNNKIQQIEYNLNFLSGLNEWDKAMSLYEESYKFVENKSDTFLFLIGTFYLRSLKYPTAMKYYQQCLALRIRLFGKESQQVTASLNSLALIYNYQQNSQKAIEIYQEILKITQKIKGRYCQSITLTLYNLGYVYYGIHKYQKALEKFTECLNIINKIKSQSYVQTSQVLIRIGEIYIEQNNIIDAIEKFQQSLALVTKKNGKQSILITGPLSKLAQIFLREGNYSMARHNYQKCLAIQRKVKGRQSFQFSQTLLKIAESYQKEGDLQKSLELCQQSLRIYIKIHGKQSSYVASQFYRLGQLYLKQGHDKKAIQSFDQSFKIYIKTIKIQEEFYYWYSVFHQMTKIGVIYQNKRLFTKAIKIYEECLEFLNKMGKKQSYSFERILGYLANIYRKQQNYQKALQKCQERLILQKKLQIEKTIIVKTLRQLGIINFHLQNYQKALEIFGQCLSIYIQAKGTESLQVADIFCNIAMVFKNKDDYQKALEKYNQCLKIQKNILGQQSIQVSQTLQTIKNLQTNRKDKYVQQ